MHSQQSGGRDSGRRGTTFSHPAADRLRAGRRITRCLQPAGPVILFSPVLGLILTVYGYRLGFPDSLIGPMWVGIVVLAALVFGLEYLNERRERSARNELYPRLRSAVAGMGDELTEWLLNRRGPDELVSTGRLERESRWLVSYGRASVTLTEAPDGAGEKSFPGPAG